MKKAFSLIELLIVILIVGIVYSISIGSFKKIKESGEKLDLENLKSYLQAIPHRKKVSVVCLNECLECEIFTDGEKYKKIKSFVDRSVKSYRYDFSYGMVELKKNNNLCFSYDVTRGGVGSQIFVEFKDKVYDMSSYLNGVTVYSSLADALDERENLVREILR